MEKKKRSGTVLGYIVIPGSLIVVVAVAVNFFLYGLETNFFENIYRNEVAETKSLIERRFESALVAAESVAALFTSSQDVSESEFNSFAVVLTKRVSSEIGAVPLTVEWVDADNNIRYVYPLNEDNAKVVGMDLNKYPNRLEPILKAKRTRAAVVTEPVMLQQGYPGLIIYSPIFKGDDYLGEAVVVVRLKSLLAPIVGTAPIYNKAEHIHTENFIIPFDHDVIFNNKGERIVDPQGNAMEDPASVGYLSDTDAVSEGLSFADKKWQLRFLPAYITEVDKRAGIYATVSALVSSAIILFLLLLQRRERRLSQEKARTEALIASIGDGLVASDKAGVITFINAKAEELSGFSVEESVGRSYYDIWRLMDSKGTLIPPEERLFNRAITKGEVINISVSDHLYILKKDGKRLPVSSTVAPVIVNGKVEGAIVVFRDVTKESEVDRMKTEFLSLASHQLLTPVSVIRWISEMLLHGDFGPLNEEQKKNIGDVYDADRRMNELIVSLLNVSRIESGRIIVDPKPTKLPDLVNSELKDLSLKIKEKGHSVSVDFEADLPEINIDPILIREVYKNLLTNAIKYTPTKGKISVSVKREGGNIVSEVKDNGYGITEEGKRRMFEKFYRGENILDVEKDGNGLGLYLVKQIIDVSGGKIWFESEVGKGTSFRFSLPVSGSEPKAGEVSIS